MNFGEIERAVNSYEKINSAICFFDDKKDKIVCVYEGDSSSEEIIKHIANSIPKYMYPNLCMKTEKMPYNPNGKIDRVKITEEYSNGANS